MAHAGDGNLHPMVVFDASDARSTARAIAAFEQVMDAALALGGTITGEHGVGRLKRGALVRQLGPVAMEVHAWIKAGFDPDGILNPGNVLV